MSTIPQRTGRAALLSSYIPSHALRCAAAFRCQDRTRSIELQTHGKMSVHATTKTSSMVTRDVCLLVEAKFGSMLDIRSAADWNLLGRKQIGSFRASSWQKQPFSSRPILTPVVGPLTSLPGPLACHAVYSGRRFANPVRVCPPQPVGRTGSGPVSAPKR